MHSPCRDYLQRVPGIWRYGRVHAFYVPSVVLTAQCPCPLLHRQQHVLLATIHRRKRSLHAERRHAWTGDLVMEVHRHGSDRSQIERERTTIAFVTYAAACRCPHWLLPAALARGCVLRIYYSPLDDIVRPDWRCHQNSKCIETIRNIIEEKLNNKLPWEPERPLRASHYANSRHWRSEVGRLALIHRLNRPVHRPVWMTQKFPDHPHHQQC